MRRLWYLPPRVGTEAIDDFDLALILFDAVFTKMSGAELQKVRIAEKPSAARA